MAPPHPPLSRPPASMGILPCSKKKNQRFQDPNWCHFRFIFRSLEALWDHPLEKVQLFRCFLGGGVMRFSGWLGEAPKAIKSRFRRIKLMVVLTWFTFSNRSWIHSGIIQDHFLTLLNIWGTPWRDMGGECGWVSRDVTDVTSSPFKKPINYKCQRVPMSSQAVEVCIRLHLIGFWRLWWDFTAA